ncbi:hypothetical protein [Rhizobium sp. Leaf341]|uniref:hypothetical protein n=1 Tax=Rhizobium sp. Leaf341 TaxID=1736344 RepID=UPI000712F2AC|nr:hypothetical protein [Rhizobium sp. Leaf341]KQR75651.1 hypothetical protein ASG03_18360 [Rhizobium sp. Leaf341]
MSTLVSLKGLVSRFAFTPSLKHAVVTTFHKKGYEVYGKRCIETFLEYWPADVEMLVYAEDVDVDISDRRLTVIDQVRNVPRLHEFRALYKDNPYANGTDPRGKGGSDNFRWDAIRFSNKVFAVTDAIERTKGSFDQLIWLDADTVTHTQFPKKIIDNLAPRRKQLAAYLNRKSYPECGWVGYNLHHPAIDDFVHRFEQSYLSGRFLKLKESHDSYVFWDIVKDMKKKRVADFKYLGSDTATGHIFINSVLGGYLDHLKGERKTDGKSHASDLYTGRKEGWWR